MAKKLWNIINELVILLMALVVGGLFISGTTQTNIIFQYFPVIIHTLVGFGIIILAIVNFIKKLL